MNRVRKQFILTAMLAIFVLLTVLLTVINGVNFTMASEDADKLTEMLSGSRGSFVPAEDERPAPQNGFGRMGPMGPSAPDMRSSLRYFTFAFDENGGAATIAFSISAVSQEEAAAWARSLLTRQGTGWTRGTYRYRIYKVEGQTFVTVIDQGRELLGSYRILVVSAIGLALGLLASFGVLTSVSKRLFKPLEENDRKQKHFIAEAQQAFKVPLTVINANTELLERGGGETEETRTIDRQVRRMTALVRELGALSAAEEAELTLSDVDLSGLCRAVADIYEPQFSRQGLTLNTRVAPQVTVRGDAEALDKVLHELLDNALKFSRGAAALTLRQADDRIELLCSSDTELPAGAADQTFDRFTRLSNADGVPGAGLGLPLVKEIVKAHNGRVSAAVADGAFTVSIRL